jgi:signal transduction histidine kinase
MTSIVAYSELLLGESVGILGALQRKFVGHIKKSTDRMQGLVDDLIQVSAFDLGKIPLQPETVDLNLVIDHAMAFTSSQLREKNITLRIDLPKTLATFNTNREALQQILIHLLQNAGAATPPEGTITLRVHPKNENGKEFILIQVVDSGGGIAQEDLGRVFSSSHRADNALIEGIGDTSMGLSLVKTLTESLNGIVGAESQKGVGSTFSVSLPLIIDTTPEPR